MPTAIETHSTSPLLRSMACLSGGLLRRSQVGPVTRAIAAIRNEPPLPPEAEADLDAARDALNDILTDARHHYEQQVEETEAEWHAAGIVLADALRELIAKTGEGR